VQVILRPFCCSVASFIAVVIAFVASCMLHAISCIVASCMCYCSCNRGLNRGDARFSELGESRLSGCQFAAATLYTPHPHLPLPLELNGKTLQITE